MGLMLRGVIVFGIVCAVTYWALTDPKMIDAAALPEHQPDLANGRTMFYAGGCASCHAAPGAKDEEALKLVGGLALKSPFGTFYAPNISPSEKSGIGGWSTIDFVNAMARGVSPTQEHYYPAFPYVSYQRMRLEDLIDLKAFIDSLPAVASMVPETDLSFPFNIRRGVGLWKQLYMDDKTFVPDETKSAQWNRGAYLVEGPGHCGACHTPRDAFGGREPAHKFAGGPSPEGEGYVPNITPSKDGIGDWTEEDIVYALKTGFTPEFDALGGSMAAVQRNMAQLSDADLAAIAHYLKSLPPLPDPPRPKPKAGT